MRLNFIATGNHIPKKTESGLLNDLKTIKTDAVRSERKHIHNHARPYLTFGKRFLPTFADIYL
jgi:hypothetical protein